MPKDIEQMIHEHKQFLYSGRTSDLQFRLDQLRKLKEAIQRYEQQIVSALYQDLRKSEFESFETEIGLTLESIRYIMKHLKRWMKPQKVKTPLYLLPSKSYIMNEPYGTALIIGPFNYPYQLLIEPLIGAIAAGNCAVLKPSESTPHVSAVIKAMVSETFDEHYIRVIEGEKEATASLIHAPFDYIFFTGSVAVGKIVMEAAAQNLIPVTLELGGKSPVIVDRTANLEIAAKRIIWGKLLNTGQTCVAPDYVLVHTDIKEALISKMKEVITSFYGSDALHSADYGRIINERQFDRLVSIIEQDQANLLYGGRSVKEELYIEPTLLEAVSWDDAAMLDEIFGPILPIMAYAHLDEVIHMINDQPKPLALYLFAENKEVENQVLTRISFGGGCVNDTNSHAASAHLPFGGVGNAGMGGYHGKHSYDTFSHRKSILKKSTRIDIGIIYPPYRNKLKWLRKLLK
ncbi:aldehyde dehydrogenase [Paenibacillus sp. DS2015]|uniref:aldehyde dehydrogenase n=1 Tax=Paenibacillus sp. DS2015 TaxID=3373917 RepID=UPI003D1BA0E9